MGITRNFFLKPICVPITLLENHVNEDGTVTQEQVQLLFELKRETNSDATQIAIANVLGSASHSELRLTRFSNLLLEVSGFDDFPDDSREMRVRAVEFFAGEHFEGLISAVMIFYDQATIPLEAYRSA